METGTPATSAIQRHPIEFTATGSEYFRIWIVNLLLTLVTLGLYLPWAKVRKLQYFYRNTWVAGDALDFHGEPRKMLRGTLIAGAFLVVYSVGSNFSGWAALLAAVAFVGLWPALFRAALRFRLANTSWRGLRFRFTGDTAAAYGCMLPPLALLLLPIAVMGAMAPGGRGQPGALPPSVSALVGLGMLAFFAALPYFLWRIRRYQHGNYAFGKLQTRLEADLGVLYGIFIKLIGISLVAMVVLGGLAFMFILFGRRAGMGPMYFGAVILVGIVGILALNILPKSYLQVRLQNLIWSRTGNDVLRFKSELPLARYLGLQCKNYLLIFLTLGLYWPFAVVNTRRAQLEAVELRTRISLDQITQTAAHESPGAVGDMAADLFGMDIGM
ncbi:YjgN family protein [Variovorax sp. Sphag1AA]|uniref:YjgN family protein n=1 Tax=Variovorax sp. Sphag1AA TaxID=2587027 RepID=UPI00161A0096|nr:YjgN family protein [Variovorax sp. Sphag1AA]